MVGKLKKVEHNHPLLSLDKTTDINKFVEYFRNLPAIIMAKEDGLTASILYRNGVMVSAESRGNGEIGEDITHTAKTFINLPQTIPFNGELIVDGECIIPYDTFEEVKRREQTAYKTPRNLVSGTVRQLDSKVAASRKVKFIAWKLHSMTENGEDVAPLTYSERFKVLCNLGFEVVPCALVDNPLQYQITIETLKSICEENHHPIDGMVAAFNDVKYGLSLGMTRHHPKHSLAFKFYSEDNETTLIDIEWNTSRTGLVNPIAVFEPIEIDGTQVERASLSNVSIIKELELGYGDTITVIKANQVIPQVTGNQSRSNTCAIPTVCPCCGKILDVRNDNGREMLYCTNRECKSVVADRYANFVSREGMNIRGLSKRTIIKLMDAGIINGNLYDIFCIELYRNRLTTLEGFAGISANKLIESIKANRECKMENFLVAIGVPDIGKSTAKVIGKCICEDASMSDKGRFSLIEHFVEMGKYGYNWDSIDGIGRLTSNRINSYICDNEEEIMILANYVKITNEDEISRQGGNLPLVGKVFCISGSLNVFKNKNELAELIEQNGGKIVSGVSKKTDYLICNDIDSSSSKNEKAKSLNISIITEVDVLDMI